MSFTYGAPDPVQCVLFVIQTMFQFVTGLMKQGFLEESDRQRHLAVSPKERPDKRNTALWDTSSLDRNSRLLLPVRHSNVFMYIVYLLSPFLHLSCLPQSLFAILSQWTKINLQWLSTTHFISELKFCCSPLPWGEGPGNMIQMADKIYRLWLNLPCNCD